MKYRHAAFVACTPLLGVASAALLTRFSADATNVQGGGGLVNTAGILSMLWGACGWYLYAPRSPASWPRSLGHGARRGGA